MAVVEYDGTCYCGFQAQPGQIKTIQGELEKALSALLQASVSISYSGRTDAGVHATYQVINFKTDKELDLYRFKWGINGLLPEDIVIKKINKVSESFDARRDAKLREYSYFVVNGSYQSVFLKKYSILVTRKLNLTLMKRAAKMFVGSRDFSAFCSSGGSRSDNVRRIFSFDIVKSKEDLIIFRIAANSFLYNMVRIIVGTLLEIGSGERALESVRSALMSGDRKLAGKTAPAKGLFLTKVVY